MRHPGALVRGLMVIALLSVSGVAGAWAAEPAARIWSWSFVPTSSVNDDVETVLGAPDVDGDGVPDVLAACEDNTVRLLSGAATAGVPPVLWTFGGDDEKPIDDRTLHLAPDTDGDGLPEVLYAASGNDRAVHLLSLAGGTQLWEYGLRETGCPDLSILYMAVPVGDVDRDGDWDAAVAAGAPCRTVFVVDAAGSLVWQYGAGDGFRVTAAAGDLDGDRRDDVLAGAGTNGLDNRAFLLSGAPASGGERALWTETWSNMVNDLTVIGDISGDGTRDVVAGAWDGRVRALDGASRGEIDAPLWEHRVSGFLDDVTRTVRLPDIDGDCIDDVAIGSFTNTVRVLSGASGQPLWPPVALGGLLTQAVVIDALPDVTGDHQWDVVVGTWNPGSVSVVDGADGTVVWTWNAAGNIATVAAAGDLDGDGLPDVVAGEMDTASAHALSGRTASCVRPGAEVENLRVARLDADRIRLTWQASGDPCHARYRVFGVPEDAAGCRARLVDLTADDEDGRSDDTSWSGAASFLGYLVVSETAAGGLGPLGHFRR
ncbi:MAG: hypothetical protein D6738_04955 [Acidobacteria bacterium]|nr:MAG: hypothetical protein D6738_04955 [Acidobacteriota bacterium]